MDEIILKWSARIAGGMLIVFTVSLFFLPQIHKREILQEMQQASLEKELEYVQEESESTEWGEVVEPEVQEPVMKQAGTIQKTSEPVSGAQLKMQLPPGVDETKIKMDNDYMNRKVMISFPCELEDYFSAYKVLGSDEGIRSMTYYQQKGKGIIELAVDQIYVATGKYMEEELYISLHNPREIYDKIVVIDAGHGGKRPGAVKDGIAEKDLTLMIVQLAKGLFDQDNGRVGVFYTRLADDNPTLDERVGLANDLNADLLVSIHINTSINGKNTELNGTQVLYRSEEEDEGKTSRRFAQICLEQMVEELESNEVGLLKGNDIRIIKESTMPVALIEVGFMTNPEEFQKLRTLRYQQKAAQAVHDAILRALDEGF